MAFKIKSELSEDQVEADLSSFLGWITPDNGSMFRFISTDEQKTGADKEYRDGVIIYVQFKVSQGFKPISKLGKLVKTFKGSELDKIRSYRNINGLSDNPTLYFQLRKKAKTAIDYQHNIL